MVRFSIRATKETGRVLSNGVKQVTFNHEKAATPVEAASIKAWYESLGYAVTITDRTIGGK